ncbi:hypothetical protein PS2_002883 [Malus domestica]
MAFLDTIFGGDSGARIVARKSPLQKLVGELLEIFFDAANVESVIGGKIGDEWGILLSTTSIVHYNPTN